MRTKTFLASTAALSLAIGVASAQDQYGPGEEETGVYGGIGYTTLDVETDNDIGDQTNAITGRVGWQMIPNFALEAEGTFGIDDGEFDFDSTEDDFDFDDNNDGDLDDVLAFDGELGVDYLVGFYGKGIYPVTDNIDLHARAGYAFIEIDSTLTAPSGQTFTVGSSESGFAFGAGASYDFSETQAIRLDYTRYEFEDANADAGTIAYEIKF